MRTRLREWLIVVGVVAMTTVVSTWPLAIRPWSIPNHQDPMFSTWRLYQWARNLFERPTELFAGNIFHPAREALLYSDAIALPAVVAAPWIRLGVPPLLVYDALVFASFLSAGLAMYLFARDVSGSRTGALVAAVVFTGAPYRMEHVYHLELLWACWIPLAFWAARRALGGDRRSAGYLALALVAQFLCCIYYGLFLITVLPLVAGLAWIARPTRVPRAIVWRLALAMIVVGAVAEAYSRPYTRVLPSLAERSARETGRYGAELVNYAATPRGNAIWGWTADVLGEREKRLSSGVLAYTLAAAALIPPFQPWTIGLIGGALFSFDASRGLHGFAYPALRRLVPPYRGLRVPARFAILVVAAVSALAAIGVARVQRAFKHPPWWSTVTLVVIAAQMVEYTTTTGTRQLPSQPPSLYAWLGGQSPTVIAHFPMPSRNGLPGAEADYQYFAQYHHHRLVNGNSGFYPKTYLRLLDAVRSFPDAQALEVLRRADVTLVIVHATQYDAKEYIRVTLSLVNSRDVEPLGTFLDDTGEARVYRMRKAG